MTDYNMNERKKTLKSLIKKTSQAIRKAPPGRLRIKNCPTPRYYQVTDSSDRCGKYIVKEDFPVAKALAQKAYLQQLQESAKQELNYISSLEQTSFVRPEDVYSYLSENRKALVDPLILSDEEYAEEWQKTPYERKGFLETDPFYVTSQGERVRSKSEILIANLLSDLGIPYRYEAPLFLDDGSVIHPDFTILKAHSRKTCYFEHYGMMDDPSYLRAFMKRETAYIQNGLIPGRDVFMSFESLSDPLNMSTLRQMLQALFLEE